MNTNGRPSSLGAPGPRTVYAGTDSSAQIMQVVASNSMIPLGLYQNVDKDQLDWGALAQQWIQMREQWSQPAEDFIPSPPPPPSFSPTRELYAPSNSFDSPETMHPYSAVQASNIASSPSKFEEQGEAPMEVEKEEEAPATSQLMLPVPAPQQTIVNPNATAAVASWQAKINQLYQIEPTQVRPGLAAAPVHQRGSGRAGRSIEAESKPSLLMDRELKLAGSGTGEPVPPVTLNGVMKESYSGGSITMNEAKRKLLPAWIREGLEKMERDKQRQFEREQERKLWEEQQRRQRCVEDATHETWNPVKHGASPAHDHTSKPEDEVDLSAASPTPTPMSENAEDGSENADDNFEEVAIAVRTALTEILLDVTGSMINTIAEETLGKINKRKGKQAQSTQVKPGLATCTGGLGLGIYGDSDEDEEEEEEEQQQKQQTAGKGEASGSDSDRDDSTDGDLSDSAVEQRLKDTIRRKQREFEASAREIEQWIDSLQQGRIETNEPKPSNSKQQLFRKLERDAYYSDDQDLDVDDEDGSGVSDGRDEANTKQSASTRPAGSSAASVNGDAGANSSVRSGSTRDGETQPVNDKLYASQQFAGRKRREKRVSRFSMLQEPRSRPPPSLNTLGMPVATTYKLGTLAYPELPAIAKTRPGDPSQPLVPDATATRANPTLADPQLLLGVLRSGGNELAAGSQLPTTEQILKRYLLAIQPPSAGTSEGMQRGQELQVAPGETKVKPAGHARHEVLNAGASSSVSSPLPYKEPSERKSAPREAHQQRERSEKGAKIADAGQHRAQHRGRDAHRHRSRSKSSRSYTRSPHSVSGSTRSRSSRSRSRSAHRERAGHSASRHRHRSERSRHRGSRRRSRSHSRSRSDSRSRTRSRSRSRSSGRSRRSPSSKYFSRRRY